MFGNIVSIHQPNLFPRLKVLQKIAVSKTYVLYDDVQYVRNDWQNRVYIRTIDQCSKYWICIPVNRPRGRSSRIDEVTIARKEVAFSKIRKQLCGAYGQSRYWVEISRYIDEAFCNSTNDNLSDFLYTSVLILMSHLSINVDIVRSSSFSGDMPRDKNLHLVELCKRAKGDSYICGTGGMSYIDPKVFNENGIDIIVQRWDDAMMIARYGCHEWKNISFLDFWARYGKNELKALLLDTSSYYTI